MKRALIAVVVLAIFAVGCAGPESNLGTTITGTTETPETTTEITAAQVVDAMGPTENERFCTALESLIVEGFSPSEAYALGFAAFEDGFGAPVNGVTAQDVFDELLSRCASDA